MMRHKGTVRMETERLILRRFTEEDAEAAYRNWTSDGNVTKFLTWPTHTSVDVSAAYLRSVVKGYEDPRSYQWVLELKSSGEIIGSLSAVGMNDDIDAVEIGWCIGRKYWGNGYTAEAARAVIAFLFDEVGANRISARHDVNNPNSGRVMQKAGMTYEGTLRSADRNNQGIVDCVVYSILKSDRI